MFGFMPTFRGFTHFCNFYKYTLVRLLRLAVALSGLLNTDEKNEEAFVLECNYWFL